jgi:hypothetical protein
LGSGAGHDPRLARHDDEREGVQGLVSTPADRLTRALERRGERFLPFGQRRVGVLWPEVEINLRVQPLVFAQPTNGIAQRGHKAHNIGDL